jgi:hypothetical protein
LIHLTVAGLTPGGRSIGKSKEIPLHPWTGPKGARKLRFPDFKKIVT